MKTFSSTRDLLFDNREVKHDVYSKRQTEKNETFAACLQLSVQ